MTYNSSRTLRAALDAVRGLDVVVVDNASADDSVAVARAYESVVTIQLSTNTGFGKACNLGIARFPDRDVFIMNPDVELRVGGVEDLQAAAHASGAGILLPTLVYPDGSPQLTTRAFPSLVELVGRLVRRSPAGSTPVPTEIPLPVDWGIGAAMLIRRNALDAVRGFDERFFLYFEDVDLCLRSWQAGLPVMVTPAIVMSHHYQRASNLKWALWRQPVRWHWQSFGRYVRKHPRSALRLNARPLFGSQ